MSIWSYLDSMVPFFLMINAAYAIATFANQTAIGTETSLPWGMMVYDKVRHPVQLYHLLSAVILILLFRPKNKRYLGFDREIILTGGYFTLFLFSFAFMFGIVQTFRLKLPNHHRQYQFVSFYRFSDDFICRMAK